MKMKSSANWKNTKVIISMQNNKNIFDRTIMNG